MRPTNKRYTEKSETLISAAVPSRHFNFENAAFRSIEKDICDLFLESWRSFIAEKC